MTGSLFFPSVKGGKGGINSYYNTRASDGGYGINLGYGLYNIKKHIPINKDSKYKSYGGSANITEYSISEGIISGGSPTGGAGGGGVGGASSTSNYGTNGGIFSGGNGGDCSRYYSPGTGGAGGYGGGAGASPNSFYRGGYGEAICVIFPKGTIPLLNQ